MKTRKFGDYTLLMDYKSPRLSGEYYECGLPITFDQYNKCAYNCQYCFSAFVDVGHAHSAAKQRQRADASGESKYRNPVRSVDPDVVRRYWFEADRRAWRGVDRMIVNLIQRRSPVHWGGLCDPFDPFEERFQVGLELLHFWRALDWPVVFSTKGTLMCQEPWASVLRGGNFRFQFSITTPDPAKSRINDSGVGTPQQRFEAMRFVTEELGCVATLRLRPIVPGIVSPEECCELIRTAHAAGATGVSTEFFCLEARGLVNRPKYERMSAAAGFDVFEFYRRNSPKQSGYMRLNRAIKAEYFLPMEKLAKSLGMRFSVSDKEFKELGNVSGCCGVFWNDETTTRTRDNRARVHVNCGTVTYAMMLAKERGNVRWSDIEPHLEWAKVELDCNVQGLMSRTEQRCAHRGQTLFEALRCQWNDPNHSKSLYKYSGGKFRPLEVDGNGDVVYEHVVDEAAVVTPEPTRGETVQPAWLFIVGPPGVGKTHVASALFTDAPHLVQHPKWTVGTGVCAAGHYTGSAFDGADTVPYNGASDCLDYWEQELSCTPLSVFDGDRFSSEPSLQRGRELGVRLLCVHITAPDEVLTARRTERGSKQDATWVRGRVTKARNFANKFDDESLLELDGSRPLLELVGEIRAFVARAEHGTVRS